MSGDWPIHAMWFFIGAAAAYVSMFAIAPVMLSSEISQAQERAAQRAREREAPDA